VTKKTILILVGVSVGGCCLFGSGLLVLGALAADDSPESATQAAAAPAIKEGGDASLGGYIIWGGATATADGFAESLAGNWMLMDGASSIDSIESITQDVVRVRSNRSGELWLFSFDADGSYAFRYVITYNRRALLNVEKGEWSSDGARLTLTPLSCEQKGVSDTNDCFEPAVRTYAMKTMQLEELTPNDRKGVIFGGLELAGPTPKFASGANQISTLTLQRVR
jgi:hypothetical protein